MTVYCATCNRFIAQHAATLLDAREFQRLHKQQTSHVAVIKYGEAT